MRLGSVNGFVWAVVLFLGSGIGHLWGGYWSPEAEEAFLRGGQSFAGGGYEEALKQYVVCLMEAESASIHHNVGLCHYKLGRVGTALWHLGRADRMDFLNPDTQNAIRFIGQIEGIREPRPGVLEQLAKLLPERVWIWSGVAALWLGVFCWGHYWLLGQRKAWFRDLGWLASVVCLVCVLAAAGFHLDARRGVVSLPEVGLQVSPAAQADALITLREGTYGKALREVNGFVYIEVDQGTRGWVDKQAFRRFRETDIR